MNDIRIPYWQSRGRGFVSLILHGTISHLPISDLVQIANEPDRTDSYLDFNGLKQMVMMVPKVEPWRAPPGSILGTWYWFNGVR